MPLYNPATASASIGVDGWVSSSASWTYASADAPTFTITVPSGAASLYSVGMRIKLTQTTVKYFIITAVADTVLTVYGGTDYTLVNAAISAISYSPVKTPLDFPTDPAKWTVVLNNTTGTTQSSATAGTWYNIGTVTISVPIGQWTLIYYGNARPSTATNIRATLSTANNSESEGKLTSIFGAAAGTLSFFSRSLQVLLAAKTSYYLNWNVQTGTPNITVDNDFVTCNILAICGYL